MTKGCEFMPDKKYVFNWRLSVPFFLLVIFVGISIFCATQGQWGLFIAFIILAILSVFVILIQPLIIVFSEREIRIVYTVGFKEIIPANEIRNIYSMGRIFERRGFGPIYVVAYPRANKMPFFANGELPKTHRMKMLLKSFYKKEFS